MRKRSAKNLGKNTGGQARSEGPDAGCQVRKQSPRVEIQQSLIIGGVCGLEADGNVPGTLVGMISNQNVTVWIWKVG